MRSKAHSHAWNSTQFVKKPNVLTLKSDGMEWEMEMVLQRQLLCFLGTLVHMDVDSVLSKIVEPAAPDPMNLRTLPSEHCWGFTELGILIFTKPYI